MSPATLSCCDVLTTAWAKGLEAQGDLFGVVLGLVHRLVVHATHLQCRGSATSAE